MRTNTRRAWNVALTTAAASLVALSMSGVAFADVHEGGGPPAPPKNEEEKPEGTSSGLSDTETSYRGAIMLRGGQEVTLDSVVPGYIGDEWYQQDGRYAYFSGNTLYAGVQDDQGNYVDMICEFFWFESSIDRGSDFYVAVVKARTSPNLKKWVLQRKTDSFLGYFLPDAEATLYLRAQTDVSQGDNAIRWDWSVPFDNYGWDAYGNVTMETKYGLSLNAEGSSQKAIEYKDGNIPVEAKVQAKGYFSKDYNVQTRYEVTLNRWEVVVHGGAGSMEWQMNLHSKDRENQNAYHEFFIAMQADQGVPFRLDWLEVGGTVKDPKWYWYDEARSLSAAVTGIVLRPPQLPPPPPSEGGDPGKGDPNDHNDDSETPGTAPGSGDGEGSTTVVNKHYYPQTCGYGRSSGSGSGFAFITLLVLGAAAGRRRNS